MVGRAPKPGSRTRHGVLWYQIEASPQELLVHIRLLDPPERTAFFLPTQWAGHADYARAIGIRGARTPDGPTPYTIDRAAGRIDVKSDDARWIQLDYSVELVRRADGRGRFHPRFIDQVLFAYGPAFLVLPSDQIISEMRDILIEVRAPSDWKMLSTWTRLKSTPSTTVKGATVHGFVAETPAALRDAFLAAGARIKIERRSGETGPREASQQGDSAITVGFDPALEVDRAHFSRRVAQILGAYRDGFGDLGAVTAYVRRAPGAEQERRGVGRRGGFVVEIPAGDSQASAQKDSTHGNPPQKNLSDPILLLLAHEAFHLWNGHYLTPSPAAEPETRWFKEGVTHYMAVKTLAELGLFSRDDVLRELSKSAAYYMRNPAARRATEDRATPTDRARLPYDRGVLLALAIDTFLAEHSDGRIGVHDWIARLLQTMASRRQDYDLGHLRAAFIEVARSIDAPAPQFWSARVAGPAHLNPAQIFRRAGLHWLHSPQQNRSRLLPLKMPQSPFPRLFPAFATAPSH
jgi:predicted metalloprotease with PDZ domain